MSTEGVGRAYLMTITPQPGRAYDVYAASKALAAASISLGFQGIEITEIEVESHRIGFSMSGGDPGAVADDFKNLGTVEYSETAAVDQEGL